MKQVIVIKQNLAGEETWRYEGKILRQTGRAVLIEAYFNRPDMSFHGIVFAKGDRFVEMYYTERWYNIYEIYDHQDGHLKGWYCNVSRPAQVREGEIVYVDLALDLLVFPDGRQLVLDEDEFSALALTDKDRRKARAALKELQAVFQPPVIFRLELQKGQTS